MPVPVITTRLIVRSPPRGYDRSHANTKSSYNKAREVRARAELGVQTPFREIQID